MLRFISVGLAGLLLAGCVGSTPWGLPEIASSQSPDNPAIVSRDARYRSVIGNYTARTATDPRSFRDTGVEMSPIGGSEAPVSNSGAAPDAKMPMSAMPGMGSMKNDAATSGENTQ